MIQPWVSLAERLALVHCAALTVKFCRIIFFFYFIFFLPFYVIWYVLVFYFFNRVSKSRKSRSLLCFLYFVSFFPYSVVYFICVNNSSHVTSSAVLSMPVTILPLSQSPLWCALYILKGDNCRSECDVLVEMSSPCIGIPQPWLPSWLPLHINQRSLFCIQWGSGSCFDSMKQI